MKGEPKRRVLGKGLGSLIPDAVAGDPLAIGNVPRATELQLAVAEIKPNPQQPRDNFAEADIESLAASIRATGILQPLVVRSDGNGRYTLVAGERRLRAAKRAGLEKVPAIVRDVPDDRLLEFALVENLQRDDLNPMETARAFRTLVRRFNLTQADVASRVGKPRSTIANFLRLLDLTESARKLLEDGSLSMGHGRALAAIGDPVQQSRLGELAARRVWSVRETEERVRRLLEPRPRTAATPSKRRDPNVVAAEQELSRRLAAKVFISQSRAGRGRIEIRFANGEDLDRVYRMLIGSGHGIG